VVTENSSQMSFIRRLGARSFSTPVKQWPSYEQTMTAKSFAERQHAVGTTKMWKWFNIVLVVPSLIACALYTIPPEIKHIKHLKEHPNEWQGYAYMRKRNHAYPWGDDSLFHNDNSNPRPPQ
jgi:cytochrome c oxidase subunit 6a